MIYAILIYGLLISVGLALLGTIILSSIMFIGINFKETIDITDQKESEIQYWMNRIDDIYNCGSYIPEYTNPAEFRDFLYKIRIAELEGKLY